MWLSRELVNGESLVTAPRNSTYVVAVAPHILSQLTTKKSPLTMVLFVMSPRSAFLSRLREIPHVVGQEVVADAAPIASADEIHVSEDFASL